MNKENKLSVFSPFCHLFLFFDYFFYNFAIQDCGIIPSHQKRKIIQTFNYEYH